jgi:predicted PurR-regulated permease PerM
MVKNAIQKMVEKNTFPLLVQVVAFLVVVLNIWVVTKLAPLIQDISLISTRVEAIEERNQRVDPLVERFIQLEERDKQIINDIQQLKQDARELLRLHGGGEK